MYQVIMNTNCGNGNREVVINSPLFDSNIQFAIVCALLKLNIRIATINSMNKEQDTLVGLKCRLGDHIEKGK
jgi:hypothetical protein